MPVHAGVIAKNNRVPLENSLKKTTVGIYVPDGLVVWGQECGRSGGLPI